MDFGGAGWRGGDHGLILSPTSTSLHSFDRNPGVLLPGAPSLANEDEEITLLVIFLVRYDCNPRFPSGNVKIPRGPSARLLVALTERTVATSRHPLCLAPSSSMLTSDVPHTGQNLAVGYSIGSLQ